MSSKRLGWVGDGSGKGVGSEEDVQAMLWAVEHRVMQRGNQAFLDSFRIAKEEEDAEQQAGQQQKTKKGKSSHDPATSRKSKIGVTSLDPNLQAAGL